MTTDLAPADLEVLEFERAWWKYAGRKEATVRQRFGISMTRYLQRLNWLIDQPGAAAYAPDLVRQLRDVRAQRRSHRNALTRGVTA